MQSPCPDCGRPGTVLGVPASGDPVSLIESCGRRAGVLAGIGGFVDAAGFLMILGLFTAHMSGNSTGLGVAWIESRSASGASAESRNRAVAVVLTAEAVMLAVFMIAAARVGRPVTLADDPAGFVVTATAATLAMGLQNAALRRVQGIAVHTTFVTGMLTEMSVAVVRWTLERRRGRHDEAVRSRRAAGIAAVIWSAYLTGAFAGAWLVHRHGIWTVTLPILLLLAMIASLLWPPRSTPSTPP